jgi:hypothetical protein
LLPDIHLKIFCFLDVCTSTCLGLTCKILWSIHSAQHRKTSLFAKIRLPWPNPHLSDSFLNVYLFQLLAGWFDAVLWKKYFMKWSSVAIDLEHAEWVMADQKQSAKEKAKVRGKADLAWFQQTKRQPMLPGLLGDGAHSFG